LLDGWTTIGRAWSDGQNAFYVTVSPNAQFVAYETDATFGSDVDPHPHERNLYELDRSTGINHLIATWLTSAVEVRDDGAVVVSYRDTAVSPLQSGLYTLDGGVTPIPTPTWPTGCKIGFETGGPGYELQCDGTDTQPVGLYRFDSGDTTATPVATADGLPTSQRTFFSVSANHRYLEVGSVNYPFGGINAPHFVYDVVAGTMLPNHYTVAGNLSLLQQGTTSDRSDLPVGDDGRLLVGSQSYNSGNFAGSRLYWYDPHDGTRVRRTEFDNVILGQRVGVNTFFYSNVWAEVGHPAGSGYATQGIIDLSAATTRWQLPASPYYVPAGVGPDGDVIVTGPPGTNSGDAEAGVDILVRSGPLPSA
jgi:hypothetical protein